MKKVVSFKVLLIGILSLVIIGCATSSFATSSVLESGNTTTPTAITSTEYENASVIPTDSNTTNTTNTAKTTNTPYMGAFPRSSVQRESRKGYFKPYVLLFPNEYVIIH